jgi:membrane protease subunit HflK
MSRPAAWIIALLLILAGYLATGLTILQPDEVGLVRRFGALLPDPWEPGPHWGFPWGIDRIDRIKVNQTRSLAVGAPSESAAPLLRAPDPANDDFLTADLNLITAAALVQYRVRDPAAHLFRSRNVQESLSAISESALTRAVASRGVDFLLTTGRSELAESMARNIQSFADREGLGVSIVAVRLGRVAPPVAVAPAFADAARSRSDRRQAITRAEEYRDRALSAARGQAREIADAAAGRVDRLVKPARGEAARFARVLAEAHKAPGVFRQRQYLEVIAEILPRFGRMIIVPPGQDLDLSIFGDRPPPRTRDAPQ